MQSTPRTVRFFNSFMVLFSSYLDVSVYFFFLAATTVPASSATIPASNNFFFNSLTSYPDTNQHSCKKKRNKRVCLFLLLFLFLSVLFSAHVPCRMPQHQQTQCKEQSRKRLARSKYQAACPHEFHIPSADSSYGNPCKEQRKSCKNTQKIWCSRWQHAGKCHQNNQPVRDGPCPYIHDRRQRQGRKKESQPDHATFPCSCHFLPVPAPLPPPVPRPDPSAGA